MTDFGVSDRLMDAKSHTLRWLTGVICEYSEDDQKTLERTYCPQEGRDVYRIRGREIAEIRTVFGADSLTFICRRLSSD